MELRVLDEVLSATSSITKVALQAGIALGVLITIIYCGKIDYYPSGLTIGDTLFFIAASLAFAFSYTFLVLGLFCAGVTVSPFLRWAQKGVLSIKYVKKKIYGWLTIDSEAKELVSFPILKWEATGFVLLGIVVLLLVGIKYFEDSSKAIHLAEAIIMMGVMYGFLNTKPKEVEGDKWREQKYKTGIVLIILLIPLSITRSLENTLNQAMSLIGVRSKAVTVQLTENHTAFLSENGISAEIVTDRKEGIYKDVDILFRGIGEYTVVRIEEFKIVVPTKEMLIGNKILEK